MNAVFIPSKIDREIADKQQLLFDRNKFYAKLNHIGYIPDEDMRIQIGAMIQELERRIGNLADNIMAIGG